MRDIFSPYQVLNTLNIFYASIQTLIFLKGSGAPEGGQLAIVGQSKLSWFLKAGSFLLPLLPPPPPLGVPSWLGQGTPLLDCQAPSNPENG